MVIEHAPTPQPASHGGLPPKDSFAAAAWRGEHDAIDFFEELPEYDVAMYTHKKMKTNAETSLEVLSDVLPLLEAQEDFSNDALYATLLKYVEEKGVKNGYVMWPIRTAVSGKQMTPGGATELMEVLGKEESIARIKKGISMLQK